MTARRRSWATRAATASAEGGVRRLPYCRRLHNTPRHIVRSPAHGGDRRPPATAPSDTAPSTQPHSTLCIKKIKAMLVLLFTRRSPVRPRWRGGLTHTVWMPGIAGSTPVARRGFSVMKPVSCVTCRSNLKARCIFSC